MHFLTAIPALLELLDLKGALVTLDAMGCPKDIAAQVVAGGGPYALTVKDNQPHLLEDIQATIGRVLDSGVEGVDFEFHETTERGHGRQESRTYLIVRDVAIVGSAGGDAN